MAEGSQAPAFPAPDEGEPLDYDAFLSYTHSDRPVAGAIQKGLHRIGRRLGQLRALRIFRDDTDLAANPDLWGRITHAMDRARFMVVVLSPKAAESYWVNKEVSHWLQQWGRDQVLLVLVDGQLQWNAKDARFDPELSDAAPPVFTESGSLPSEPLYIDVSPDAPWDPRAPAFRDKVTSLAAPIHGKPKSQLASDDLREQRRFRRLRAAAITGLAMLTVITVVAAAFAFVQRQEAIQQRQEAVRQRDAATALKLTSQGQAMLAGFEGGGDVRAIQQILAAARIAPDSDIGVQLTAVVERQDTIKIIQPPQGSVLAFSRDGHRMLYGSDASGTTVQLWDTDTSKPIGQPFKASDLGDVAFSPDGRRLATVGRDIGAPVQLRSADTGQPIGQPLTESDLNPVVTIVAFSPDGHRIVTAVDLIDDAQLRVWNADSGQQIGPPLIEPASRVNSVAFSPDGHVILSGDLDGALWRWNADTGQPIGQPLTDPDLYSMDAKVAFSPDGHVIAAGYYQGPVRLWNADTGQPIGQPLTGHTAEVNSVAFSPDGHRIVSGSSDRTLRVWNADTGQLIGQPLTGHTAGVNSVAFSSDGQHILSASNDGTLRIWDPDPNKPLQSGGALTVAFSQDSRRIFSAGSDSTVWTWDTATGQQIGQPVTGPGTYAGSAAFSPDGRRVVSQVSGNGATDKTLLMWDAATGRQIGPPLTGEADTRGLAFSPDGHRIASRSLQDARLWNADTGQQIGSPLAATIHVRRAGAFPFGIAFSPDGHRVASGGYGVGVWLWNADTGQQIAKPPDLGGLATSVAFSPDGRRIASGGYDKTVRLWNVNNGLPTGPTLTGSNDRVNSVAFSPDGHVIASGSADGTLRLWNADSGQQIGPPLTGHTAAVDSVAFSPDGRWFASGSSLDFTLRLWPGPAAWPELLCSKLSANMTHKQWHDWVSPDIPYITVCPGLPIAPD